MLRLLVGGGRQRDRTKTWASGPVGPVRASQLANLHLNDGTGESRGAAQLLLTKLNAM